jgi:predicted DNA-binding transcriptional regulator AlpA
MPVARLFWFLEEQRLLTVDDLARIFHTTRRGIYNRRHRGDCPPPVKVGASLRWDPNTVAKWIEARSEKEGQR